MRGERIKGKLVLGQNRGIEMKGITRSKSNDQRMCDLTDFVGVRLQEKRQFRDLNAKLSQQIQKTMRLELENANLTTRIESQLHVLEFEAEELKSGALTELHSLRKEMNSLKNQIDGFQQENIQLRTNFEVKNSEMELLEDVARALKLELDECIKNLNHCQEHVAYLENKKSQLEKSNRGLLDEKLKLFSELSQVKEAETLANAANKTAYSEAQALRAQNEFLQKCLFIEVKVLKEKSLNKNLDEKLERLIVQMRNSYEEQRDLVQFNKEFNTRELLSEISIKNHANCELKKELATTIESLRKMRRENDSLKEAIRKKEQLLQMHQEKLEMTNKKMESMTNSLKEFEGIVPIKEQIETAFRVQLLVTDPKIALDEEFLQYQQLVDDPAGSSMKQKNDRIKSISSEDERSEAF